MNNNNRRTRVRRQIPNRRSENRLLRSQLHGHQNRLRHMAPPPVNRRPYNTLVLDHVFANPGNVIEEYGPGDLFSFWLGQSGLETFYNALDEPQQALWRSTVNFKLKRVDAYAMATGGSTDRPSVFLDVASLIPGVGDTANITAPTAVVYPLLKRIEDVGNLSMCAKASYTFPLHMADIPLNETADFNFAAVSSNVPNVSMRFYVEWSFSNVSVPLPT